MDRMDTGETRQRDLSFPQRLDPQNLRSHVSVFWGVRGREEEVEVA